MTIADRIGLPISYWNTNSPLINKIIHLSNLIFGFRHSLRPESREEHFLADVSTQLKNKNTNGDLKPFHTKKCEGKLAPRVPFIWWYHEVLRFLGYGITVNRKFWRLTFTVWFVSAENVANSSIGGITLRAFLTWNSLCKSDEGDNLNASCYHIVRPLTSTAVGAELSHSFSTQDNTRTVGTQHALDPMTTVKARMSNRWRASALIQHEWRLKVTLHHLGRRRGHQGPSRRAPR